MSRIIKYRGIDIDFHASPVYVDASADSPPGMVFADSGCHSSCCGFAFNTAETRKVALNSVKQDIDGGFEPCTDPDCEICFCPWCRVPEGQPHKEGCEDYVDSGFRLK